MMTQRILCILDSLDAGGAETFMMKLYRAMDRDAYQMDFVVCASGCYDEEVLRLGGRVYHIPLRTKHPVRSFRELKKLVRANHCRYVLKLCTEPIAAVDLIAARLGGAAWIGARSCNAGSASGTARRLLNRLLRPLFNSILDYKLAPSDLAARYTFGRRAYERGEVVILPNALDLSIYRFDSRGRREVRAEFGLAPDAHVIGHVGRFSGQKNHAFLLDIFAAIHSADPAARLLLVGEGELEQTVREKAERLGLTDAVVFTGVRSDIPRLLSAMDVFVFPSLYEGMPNAVIEAQATGLPCVIADTITREADITGLVRYMPLTASAEAWSDAALGAIAPERADTSAAFLENGYDIASVAAQFTDLIFHHGGV